MFQSREQRARMCSSPGRERKAETLSEQWCRDQCCQLGCWDEEAQSTLRTQQALSFSARSWERATVAAQYKEFPKYFTLFKLAWDNSSLLCENRIWTFSWLKHHLFYWLLSSLAGKKNILAILQSTGLQCLEQDNMDAVFSKKCCCSYCEDKKKIIYCIVRFLKSLLKNSIYLLLTIVHQYQQHFTVTAQ